MEYYQALNHGLKYFCDRCKVKHLREDEYNNNRFSNGCIYCDECKTYIKIQRYVCVYCWNSWTVRSERLLPKECECGGLVVWQK